MKKFSLVALAAIFGFALTSCGGTSIEYDKAYLSGQANLMGLDAKVEVKLQKDNKTWFDMTILGDKHEFGGMDFNEIYDLFGTYTYADNNYTFKIEYKKQVEGETITTTKDWKTTYDATKKEHKIAYQIDLENGTAVKLDLVGALPLL